MSSFPLFEKQNQDDGVKIWAGNDVSRGSRVVSMIVTVGRDTAHLNLAQPALEAALAC